VEKLHNEELHDLYCSLTIVRVIKIENEMGGSCRADGEMERCVQGFGEETWGKETTGETQA
jgi:hypothetical protein